MKKRERERERYIEIEEVNPEFRNRANEPGLIETSVVLETSGLKSGPV